jgi:TM2 domain-containing membrane protein YozV
MALLRGTWPVRTFGSTTMSEQHVPNPGVAAVLSLVVPGVGQFYNGKFLRGIFWLIITPGLWIGTGGWLGWICHVVAAFTAYNYARKHQR